jgi:hypothetical protein
MPSERACRYHRWRDSFMRSENPKIERSAPLLDSSSATFALQVDRMVRQASHPGRRIFRDRAELRDWLQEPLGPDERTALEAFLFRD